MKLFLKTHTYFILISVSILFNFCSEKKEPLDHLIKYVENKKDFSYEIKDSVITDTYKTYHIKMYSGKWLTKQEVNITDWWHWVDVVVPNDVESNKALMFIGGGTRLDNNSFLDSITKEHAVQTKSVIAHISNIPFQPVSFKGSDGKEFYEDDLIAYGWKKFLKNGAKDNDLKWLARFPMTRAVSRAFDVVEKITKHSKIPVSSFFVAGASKRGWTTWTTAAVDSRVIGMAPIVIDMLNVRPSMQNHFKAYGEWSIAIDDYKNHDIMEWMNSKEYEKLLKHVEPYEFIDKFSSIPKFIINGTIDEFFATDSWRFYWDDLKGIKQLQYVPNGNHGLNGDYYMTLKNLMSYYYRVINNIKMPAFDWSIKNDSVYIKIDPKQEYLISKWTSNNPKERDFRIWKVGDSSWIESKVEKNNSGIYVFPKERNDGYTAGLIEVEFYEIEDFPLKLTSGTWIYPDTYPFNEFKPKLPLGTPLISD